MPPEKTIIEQLTERMAAREAEAPPPEDEDLGEPTEAPEGEAPGVEAQDAPEGEAPESVELPTDLLGFGKAAGWEPEDVYDLTITLDTGDKVKLGEIKDRLQVYERERDSIKAQETQLREYAQQVQTQAQQYLTQRQEEGAEAQDARREMAILEARYGSVDWDKLAAADPGRAAYLQQQLAAEYAGAQRKHAEAVSKEQQAIAQMVEHTRAQHAKALLEAVPEWRDSSALQAEFPEVQRYLGQWFRPEELETIYDWRAISLARKAYLYDQGKQRAKETVEKVKAAPKPVLRPGAPMLHGAAAQAREKALIRKARESRSQSDKDAAAAAVLSRAFGIKR